MPFQITTQPFGPLPTGTAPLTEYLLEHTETGEFITVIPEFGGILRRLVLRKGRNLFALLKAPESPQALLADEGYASALLYPFPGRIRHGIYTFDGEAYTLPMNEVSHYNALHGLVQGRAFAVASQDVTPTHARLVLRCDYPGDVAGYPFPFALTMTYELGRADSLPVGSDPSGDRMCALRVSYSARNVGQVRCPAAFGWHPYFMLNAEPTDDLMLSLPARTPIALDENLLPTGQLPRQNAETISLRDRQLNTPFLIEPTGVSASGQPFAETVLTSAKTGVRLIVGQPTGVGGLDYLVCYTPPRRDSVAIEPQTAGINAFNNGDGLTILEPGGTLSGTVWVRLE